MGPEPDPAEGSEQAHAPDDLAALAEPGRLAALARAGLMGTEAEPSFDRLTRLATRFLGVPVALVSLVDAERQFFKSCVGLPSPWAERRETPLSHSFCQHVVATGEPLVVRDARLDPILGDNLAIPDIGVVAYLGIPVRVDGHVIGSFCAIDGEPRDWTEGDVATMRDLADSVVSEVRLRAETAEADRQRLAAEVARQNAEVTLASVGDGIIATDHAGVVTFINRAATLLCGWAAAAAVGRPVADVFAIAEEATGKPIPGYVDRVLGSGNSAAWRDRTILLARDGTRRQVEECAAPILVEGRVVGAVVTFRDVGPRKQQEKALEDARRRLQFTLEAGAVATWTWDIPSDTLVPDANTARLFSIPPELSDGGPIAMFLPAIHPDDLDRTMAVVNRSLATGEYYEAEYRLIQADGSVRWVIAKSTPTLNPDGSPESLSGVVIDITDRKRAEEAIRQSERRLRAFVNATSDAVYHMDADWSELLQLRGQEFIVDTDGPNRDWPERYVDPVDRGRVAEAIAEAVRTKGIFELEHRVRRVDGSVGWTASRAVPILGDDGEVVEWFGTARDITGQKFAAEALARSEEKYRTLFRSMDEGYCVIRMLFDHAGHPYDWVYVETNAAFEAHTGLAGAEGHTTREVAPGMDPHWFELYGRVARTGEPARYVNEAKVLGERWFEVYAFRLGRPGDDLVAVLFRDVTDRLRGQAEREMLLDRLTDADRRKDEFLAMLAHELRNPLGAINTAVHLARRGDDAAELAELHDTIQHQVRHLNHLIDDLLDVSRITQGKIGLKKQAVELRAVTARAVALARPQVEEKRHRLAVRLPDDPVPFEADPVRVEQMISNLLTNAAKYSEPGRAIDLRAGVEGGEVVFRVRDQGHGISAEMLSQIFGLFTQVDATIDRARGGLGIGLTLVRRLAEMHGGSIEAASAGKGHGSEFTLRLPIGDPASLPTPVGVVTPRKVPPSGHVLVVDDSVMTARLTARMLRQAGFEVDVANDGTAGLELALRVVPAAILLDIGLPGLNGYEVARRLREDERCRAILIIAVSGYGEQAAREQSRAAGFDHHLTKPLDFEDLMAALGA